MKKKVPKKKNPDNKIKGYLDAQRAKSDEDTKRYLVLSEDFQGRVSVVAEQFLGLNKKIDDSTNRLESKVEGIERKLDSHTEMIGKLMVDVEIIKKNVEFLKGGLKKKVDYDEFLALERRITLLESKTK